MDSTKHPFGETSFWRNVHSAKRPFGETSFRRNVHSVKCPFGEMSFWRHGFGKMDFGETAFGEMYRNYTIEDTLCFNSFLAYFIQEDPINSNDYYNFVEHVLVNII